MRHQMGQELALEDLELVSGGWGNCRRGGADAFQDGFNIMQGLGGDFNSSLRYGAQLRDDYNDRNCWGILWF
jgi:hypothetical protein